MRQLLSYAAITVAMTCPFGALADGAIDTIDSPMMAGNAGWRSAQRGDVARDGEQPVQVAANGSTRQVLRDESARWSDPIYRYGQRELSPEELPMKGRAPIINRTVPGDR